MGLARIEQKVSNLHTKKTCWHLILEKPAFQIQEDKEKVLEILYKFSAGSIQLIALEHICNAELPRRLCRDIGVIQHSTLYQDQEALWKEEEREECSRQPPGLSLVEEGEKKADRLVWKRKASADGIACSGSCWLVVYPSPLARGGGGGEAVTSRARFFMEEREIIKPTP